jgi:Cu-processing system ATP-binding protein
MITAKNITKTFGKLVALDDVSISCDKGECVALIGPNGSGKTTLIKTFLGMVVPGSGTITFDGKRYFTRQQLPAGHWLYATDREVS